MNGLVLSGGGARSAYQVGVLSYLAEKAPEVTFPIITGVSAGSINAAFLAGFRGDPSEGMQELARCWCSLTIERVFHSELRYLGVSGLRWIWTLGGAGTSLGPPVKGLVDTNPLREFLVENLDPEGIQENVDEGRLRAVGITALHQFNVSIPGVGVLPHAFIPFGSGWEVFPVVRISLGQSMIHHKVFVDLLDKK